MLFKVSNPNSNLALTKGYLNPALNNSTLTSKLPVIYYEHKVLRKRIKIKDQE